MTRSSLVAIMLLMLAGATAAHGQMVEEDESEALQMSSERTAEERALDPSEAAELIVEKTNSFRQEQGLQPVQTNPKLSAAAQYFADYMARTDTYGHTADGKRPAERAQNHDYDYCLVAENIAYQYSSRGFTADELAERFVEGWKNSPKHRENMLNSAVVDTGVALAQSDKTGYWYAVQMFGRPKSAAIEFSITNRSDSTIEYTIGERSFPLPPRYSRTHVRCRQTNIEFGFSDDQGRKEQIKPKSGERYAVVQEGGGLDVVRQ